MKPKHTALVYHRAAFTHFAQLVPLTVAFGLALVTMSIIAAIGALALGEAVLVILLPRTARFRASVDETLESAERIAAAEARASVLARMSDVHLRELAEIERLAAGVRERWASEARCPDVAVERAIGLERLLLAYVRVAIAHRRNVESFGLEARLALEAHAARVAALPAPSGERAYEWLERRREILMRRKAAWAAAESEREAIAQALATIADVVRWLHEIAASPAEDEAEVDRVLSSCLGALAETPSTGGEPPIEANVLLEPPALCA